MKNFLQNAHFKGIAKKGKDLQHVLMSAVGLSSKGSTSAKQSVRRRSQTDILNSVTTLRPSVFKQLSLISNFQGYVLHIEYDIIPSLLVPLPEANKVIRSAMVDHIQKLSSENVYVLPKMPIQPDDQAKVKSSEKDSQSGGFPQLKIEVQNIPDLTQSVPNPQNGEKEEFSSEQLSTEEVVVDQVEGIDVSGQTDFLVINSKDLCLGWMSYREMVQQNKEHGIQLDSNQNLNGEQGNKEQQETDERTAKSKKPKYVPLGMLILNHGGEKGSAPLRVEHLHSSAQFLVTLGVKTACLCLVIVGFGLLQQATRYQNHYIIHSRIKKHD